jgi:curved DNA-binding protein CbpA
MSWPRNDEQATRVASVLLWEQQLDELDYYALLGVTSEGTPVEYEVAYHRFALQFHPDCHLESEPRVRQALTRIFQRGVEARRVLCDAQLHARYRKLHEQGAKRLLDESRVVEIDLEHDLPNLHESCRSAGAKLQAMSAARAWQNREFEVVRQQLDLALAFDGRANQNIEHCIEAIELALSEMGHPTR